ETGEDPAPFGRGGDTGALGKWDYLGRFLDSTVGAADIRKYKNEQKRAEEEAQKRAELQEFMKGQLPVYADADKKYADTYAQNTADVKKLMDEYLKNFTATMQGAIGNVNQAQESYKDTWLGSGGMKDQMTANAQSALTLEELMDPDNKVAQAF